MQQLEQRRCTRKHHNAETLTHIADEILAARALVWAGWLASQQVDGEAGAAIGELLDTVAHRLTAVAEKTERAGQTDAAARSHTGEHHA